MPFFPLVSLAACLLFVIALPFCSRRIDWFSTWSFVFYSVFIGVFLRSIYITFDFPSSSAIQYMFLRGKPKEFLLEPMLIVLLGMSFMTLGYLAGPRVARKIAFRVFRLDCWSEKRFLFLVLFLQLLAGVGIYFFIIKTLGGLSKGLLLENISVLRGVSPDLREYRAYGYLRWMASLSNIVCYLTVAKLISSRHPRFQDLILFLLSLASSLFFYVFVSSRSAVIFILINLLVISYYLRYRKLNFSMLMLVGIFALFFMRVLSTLRPGYGVPEASQQKSFSLMTLIEPIVLNRNLIDVSKTAHIIKAIPQNLDYQWGQTLITFLFAWIPRSFWPGKPVVNIDNILGMVVFGSKTYGSGGLPPGIIAEMYWNFSFPGIIAGCFAVGYLLKIIDVNFKAYSSNRNIVLLYVTSFMQLGMFFIGSSFSPIVIGFLTSFFPLYIVLHIITRLKFRKGAKVRQFIIGDVRIQRL